MNETPAIDFYFEYSSPYGYLASELIGPLADRHGVRVNWRPFLLGAVFKKTGGSPLVDQPLKGDYSRRDMMRTARLHDLPFQWPAKFPVFPVPCCRATYWVTEAHPEKTEDLVHALYRGAWATGRPVWETGTVLDIASETGLDRDAVEAGIGAPAIKERLKAETEAAMELGVFGSPFFLYRGEPFWGVDRLDQLDKWIETGGW
ncbi:MAG: 2-hydroxychromene-2-carboxylate isomerase [Alphaproteobacteria bacterium]